jgi:hypothetical protein
MNKQPGSLDMFEKLVAKSNATMGSFDQPWNICYDKGSQIWELDDP